MRKELYLLLLLPMVALCQTPATTENYIWSTIYKVPTLDGVYDVINGNPLTDDQKQQTINYYDGLGRPLQTVGFGQSNSGKDIVTLFTYDGFGRQAKEYLPYRYRATGDNFSSDPVNEQFNFYSSASPSQTGNPHFEATANAYSEKLLENSPLNRILKQAAPGNDWVMGNGKEVKFDYQTNGFEEVRYFEVLHGSDYTISLKPGVSYYKPTSLYKNIIKNENWTASDGQENTTEEFKTMQGQLVLKRMHENLKSHDTYYVYDVYGNLTYVIPPLADTTGALKTDDLDLCYKYQYDHLNRLVEKQIPGKKREYLVYDKLDRVVATGPANSPFDDNDEQGWLITKYDVFNRIVYTGWNQDNFSGSGTRTTLQNIHNGSTIISESRKPNYTNIIDGVTTDYTSDVYPTSGFKLLTINYYDDYDMAVHTAGSLPQTVLDQERMINVKGLATGSWVRVPESMADLRAESSYTYYDKKARPVLQYKQNHLGGFTNLKSKYDFTGQLLLTENDHAATSTATPVHVVERMEYNPQGKLVNHFHQIDSLPEELLAHHEYDELGNLIAKNVGGPDTATFNGLQQVDYTYNARGWLKTINNINNLTEDATSPPDLFGFRVNYNEVQGVNPDIEPLYNGNISETYWITAQDYIIRAYGYQYDKLNRLRHASYQKPQANIPLTQSYDETVEYDKNGNIVFLKRNGNLDVMDNPLEIDFLEYQYQGNQLRRVNDQTNSPLGFKDEASAQGGNDPDDDYTYDAHGNMTTDANKGITQIKYNHLNLPVKIVFNANPNTRINYIYNALGQKVHKAVRSSANTIVFNTDYLDGFQYLSSRLQYFPTVEGYVKATTIDSVYHYNYVYHYLDHLGNVRVSYGKDPDDNVVKILEENHYYPFGLRHTNYNPNIKAFMEDPVEENVVLRAAPPVGGDVGNPELYKYKYNGKEWQDELGLNMYDMEARNYMPDLGRWANIDELAEAFYEWSPYNFSYNSPIYFKDPTGLSPESLNSTFVKDGIVVEHRDDGDDNVYSVDKDWKNGDSKSGLRVIGKEMPGEVYKPGYRVNIISGYALAFNRDHSAKPIGGAGDILGIWEALAIGAEDSDIDIGGIALLLTKGKHGRVSTSLFSNTGKNAKKMTLEQIEKLLGANWHKNGAKSNLIKKFSKQLKGDTNADFYIDKSTKEVLLKSNKSEIWISTGKYLK